MMNQQHDSLDGEPRQLVALSDNASGDDNKRVWIQLAEIGAFKGHPAGHFELTSGTFAEIVRNFKNDGLPIPFDFEHASEMDPRGGNVPSQGAPAVGWIYELDNREALGLWGLVGWLPIARDYIRAKRYKYLSPTIRFATRDRVTGAPAGARLSSAALTNQPFLRSLAPLAASDRSLNHANESATMSVSVSNNAVSDYAERLMSDGYAPEKARALAIASVARAVAAAVNPTAAPAETVALCARINSGELTIVQLADKIQKDQKVDRDTAFDRAGTMLRASR